MYLREECEVMSRWVEGVLQLVSKFCWWLSPSKGFSGLIRKAGGGMETQEGGDVCILIDGSHCCRAETSTTL